MCPCGMAGHLLVIFPRVVYLGLQVDLFPIFWGTFRLISRVVVQFAILPAMEECSSLSTSSPTCVVTWSFDLSHSDWCKVECQGCFDMHFSVEAELSCSTQWLQHKAPHHYLPNITQIQTMLDVATATWLIFDTIMSHLDNDNSCLISPEASTLAPRGQFSIKYPKGSLKIWSHSYYLLFKTSQCLLIQNL